MLSNEHCAEAMVGRAAMIHEAKTHQIYRFGRLVHEIFINTYKLQKICNGFQKFHQYYTYLHSCSIPCGEHGEHSELPRLVHGEVARLLEERELGAVPGQEGLSDQGQAALARPHGVEDPRRLARGYQNGPHNLRTH